jgi:hypothetical protein
MDRPEAIPSGSDAGTAAAVPEQVAALGLRISQTLLRDSQDDPTAVWIGMRIAELMHDAEHAATAQQRTRAARDCQDLVLAAWRQRRTWPRGWPPSRVAEITSGLQQLVAPPPPNRRPPVDPSSPGWSGRLVEALTSVEREQRLWTLLALRELDVEDLDAWVELTTVATGPAHHTAGAAGTPAAAAPSGIDRPAAQEVADEVAEDEAAEEELYRLMTDYAREAEQALQQLLPRPGRGRDRGRELDAAEVTAAAVKELRRLLNHRLALLKIVSG